MRASGHLEDFLLQPLIIEEYTRLREYKEVLLSGKAGGEHSRQGLDDLLGKLSLLGSVYHQLIVGLQRIEEVVQIRAVFDVKPLTYT